MMPTARSGFGKGWNMATQEIQISLRQIVRRCDPETCWGNFTATTTKPGWPSLRP
jgi:hypothetical protein